jgi:hypothetical protein
MLRRTAGRGGGRGGREEGRKPLHIPQRGETHWKVHVYHAQHRIKPKRKRVSINISFTFKQRATANEFGDLFLYWSLILLILLIVKRG